MAKDIPYDQKYYDPEIECMPRPELEALQLERLKDMVAYAYDNTVYYKRAFDEAGVKPGDIESLDDIAKFPFCDKKTERETQHVGSFFGEMCSVPEEEVIFMATSSGSTGVPTVSPFTQEDFDLWQDTEARLFWQAGDVYKRQYCDCLQSCAQTRFYRGVAKLTRGFVHMDEDMMDDAAETLC